MGPPCIPVNLTPKGRTDQPGAQSPHPYTQVVTCAALKSQAKFMNACRRSFASDPLFMLPDAPTSHHFLTSSRLNNILTAVAQNRDERQGARFRLSATAP